MPLEEKPCPKCEGKGWFAYWYAPEPEYPDDLSVNFGRCDCPAGKAQQNAS